MKKLTAILQTTPLLLLLILLVGTPRLTEFWGYAIVDEPDRWRWAEDFAWALHRGDPAATLVGDGYPGIVPVWAENAWIYAEMTRRSWREGQWIGEPGLYQLLHQWQRSDSLHWQRLPIVLLNSLLALTVSLAVWRLGSWRLGLLAGSLIALDPFYLSDSRVNRAEAVISGLMTLSVLCLALGSHAALQSENRQRTLIPPFWLILSGLFGGLSLLTKIQALVLLPTIGLIGLWLYLRQISTTSTAADSADFDRRISPRNAYQTARQAIPVLLRFGLIWAGVAALTWVILWPAMWVTPLETLTLVYNYTTRKVGAEGVNLFFWGQTYQNADPGWLFYPVVFLFRATPLTLLGLLALLILRFRTSNPDRVSQTLIPILLIYIGSYTLAMSVGSHKQDRYLMPIFLALNILAAIGWLGLWMWLKPYLTRPKFYATLALSLFLLIQTATIYPHHPYYFSYFNPLLGGGPVAAQTLRVGWGEGMDQVADYLSAKPDASGLLVATRFTENMVGFKGEVISLLADGRWTQADYIVLYIQQVQRYQEPSPAFLDYFLAREPEHIIRIGGIDYARIYPRPFTVSANPNLSRLDGQMRLFGYRWEAESPTLRLFWEDFGLDESQTLVSRLVGERAQTEWATCHEPAEFRQSDRTDRASHFVESLCPLENIDLLPTATYTVEFALSDRATLKPIFFPEGWQAARLTESGLLTDTTLLERLDLLTQQALPSEAQPSARLYQERLRLVGYSLDPPTPTAGETLTVSLYWQKVAEMLQPLTLTVQLADSRLLPLGRTDETLPVQGWFEGAVMPTQHHFQLAEDLVMPLAGLVEVKLFDGRAVQLHATDLTGQAVSQTLTRFSIVNFDNEQMYYTKETPEAVWQDGVSLRGYTVSAEALQAGETVTVDLFWQTDRPIEQSYAIFVHLVNQAGEIVAQHDGLPRAGAYPTAWWQPQQTVLDRHQLTLPPDLPADSYRLLVGLYQPDTFARLPLANESGDRFLLTPFD